MVVVGEVRLHPLPTSVVGLVWFAIFTFYLVVVEFVAVLVLVVIVVLVLNMMAAVVVELGWRGGGLRLHPLPFHPYPYLQRPSADQKSRAN